MKLKPDFLNELEKTVSEKKAEGNLYERVFGFWKIMIEENKEINVFESTIQINEDKTSILIKGKKGTGKLMILKADSDVYPVQIEGKFNSYYNSSDTYDEFDETMSDEEIQKSLVSTLELFVTDVVEKLY